MLKNLEVFKNEEFGEIRTVVIDGEPWFVGKDIAKALGYSNTRDALISHVDNDDKNTVVISDGKRGNPNQVVINESGIYALIFGSKLPSAKKFKHWVTSIVLPTIRKTGGYINNADSMVNTYFRNVTDEQKELLKAIFFNVEKQQEQINFLKKENQVITKEKEKVVEEKQKAEKKIEKQKTLVDYAQQVSVSESSISMDEFAKVLKDENNFDIGRNRLFRWLRENKYLMSNNTPYQKFLDKGYFKVIQVYRKSPFGLKLFSKTLITGKGQYAIYEKLKKDFGKAA
jgi:prophage antirepressor-like protein